MTLTPDWLEARQVEAVVIVVVTPVVMAVILQLPMKVGLVPPPNVVLPFGT
jgi:hypothetical protein